MELVQIEFIAANAKLLKHPSVNDFAEIIKSSGFHLAYVVWNNIPDKGCTLQDLACITDYNINTVSAVVRALEKGEVLRRSPYQGDRRQTFVEKITDV